MLELPAEPEGIGALLPIGAALGDIVLPVEPVVPIGLAPGPVLELPAEPVGIEVPLPIVPPELGALDPMPLLCARTMPVLAKTMVAAIAVVFSLLNVITISGYFAVAHRGDAIFRTGQVIFSSCPVNHVPVIADV